MGAEIDKILEDYRQKRIDLPEVRKQLFLLFSVVRRSEQLITDEEDAFDRGYTKGWTEGFISGKADGDYAINVLAMFSADIK
jgi:flagellar biosynthesis/type III secretory pathway protein FliH